MTQTITKVDNNMISLEDRLFELKEKVDKMHTPERRFPLFSTRVTDPIVPVFNLVMNLLRKGNIKNAKETGAEALREFKKRFYKTDSTDEKNILQKRIDILNQTNKTVKNIESLHNGIYFRKILTKDLAGYNPILLLPTASAIQSKTISPFYQKPIEVLQKKLNNLENLKSKGKFEKILGLNNTKFVNEQSIKFSYRNLIKKCSLPKKAVKKQKLEIINQIKETYDSACEKSLVPFIIEDIENKLYTLPNSKELSNLEKQFDDLQTKLAAGQVGIKELHSFQNEVASYSNNPAPSEKPSNTKKYIKYGVLITALFAIGGSIAMALSKPGSNNENNNNENGDNGSDHIDYGLDVNTTYVNGLETIVVEQGNTSTILNLSKAFIEKDTNQLVEYDMDGNGVEYLALDEITKQVSPLPNIPKGNYSITFTARDQHNKNSTQINFQVINSPTEFKDIELRWDYYDLKKGIKVGSLKGNISDKNLGISELKLNITNETTGETYSEKIPITEDGILNHLIELSTKYVPGKANVKLTAEDGVGEISTHNMNTTIQDIDTEIKDVNLLEKNISVTDKYITFSWENVDEDGITSETPLTFKFKKAGSSDLEETLFTHIIKPGDEGPQNYIYKFDEEEWDKGEYEIYAYFKGKLVGSTNITKLGVSPEASGIPDKAYKATVDAVNGEKYQIPDTFILHNDLIDGEQEKSYIKIFVNKSLVEEKDATDEFKINYKFDVGNHDVRLEVYDEDGKKAYNMDVEIEELNHAPYVENGKTLDDFISEIGHNATNGQLYEVIIGPVTDPNGHTLNVTGYANGKTANVEDLGNGTFKLIYTPNISDLKETAENVPVEIYFDDGHEGYLVLQNNISVEPKPIGEVEATWSSPTNSENAHGTLYVGFGLYRGCGFSKEDTKAYIDDNLTNIILKPKDGVWDNNITGDYISSDVLENLSDGIHMFKIKTKDLAGADVEIENPFVKMPQGKIIANNTDFITKDVKDALDNSSIDFGYGTLDEIKDNWENVVKFAGDAVNTYSLKQSKSAEEAIEFKEAINYIYSDLIPENQSDIENKLIFPVRCKTDSGKDSYNLFMRDKDDKEYWIIVDRGVRPKSTYSYKLPWDTNYPVEDKNDGLLYSVWNLGRRELNLPNFIASSEFMERQSEIISVTKTGDSTLNELLRETGSVKRYLDSNDLNKLIIHYDKSIAKYIYDIRQLNI